MIKKEDLIIAFFPCTRFEAKVPLWFRGQAQQQKYMGLYLSVLEKRALIENVEL